MPKLSTSFLIKVATSSVALQESVERNVLKVVLHNKPVRIKLSFALLFYLRLFFGVSLTQKTLLSRFFLSVGTVFFMLPWRHNHTSRC